MAGTCPHCGIRIAGQLCNCPNCGSYCLLTQDSCPDCNAELQAPLPEEETEGNENKPLEEEKEVSQSSITILPTQKKKKKSKKKIVILIVFVILLILAGGGLYYYNIYRQQQKEQADYERLEGITNPEFYQQFLNDHPDSKYYDEINERMLALQAEVEDWNAVLRNVNRSSIEKFMQKHPNSLQQRACEDLLDSIDWHDALASGNESAITDYLHRHPAGRYVGEAADRKNAMLLSKVTPEEKAMIRGTLESFFSRAIAGQDIEAARAAIPDTMISFCGKQNADVEAIIEYANDKMADDVIGLHYSIGQRMEVHKETLPDGNTGFAVEVTLHETIIRINMFLPVSYHHRVNALLNQEKKIVKMNIN